jgi:hypothetical protein
MVGVHSEDAVLDLLVEPGASDIDHPRGTLLQHLRRVASLLEQSGASRGSNRGTLMPATGPTASPRH